jgi:hypothetical protein
MSQSETLQQCSIFDLTKIFFTSKCSYLLFFFAGTANWGITNSKPPGPIIMMSQSETLQQCSIFDLAKIFFTSKCSYLLFFFAGTANCWGTTNSKPPGLIIMMGQSEILSSSQILFIITLFSTGA